MSDGSRPLGSDRDFVLIRVPTNDPEDPPTEGVWAEPLGGGRFRLSNVPFYLYGLALDDIVRVEASGAVTPVERGGHSTLRVFFDDASDEATRTAWLRRINDLGAAYEQARNRLYAIDVPTGVDVGQVRQLLERGEHESVWEFEDGYLFVPEL